MKKRWTIFLAVVLLLGLLCGCSSNKSAYDYDMPTAPGYSNSTSAAAPEMSGGYNGWMTDAADYDMPAEAPMPMPEPQSPSAGLPENVKIIYTADVNLESTAFDETVRGLEALVANMGGYFEYSNLENYNSYYRTGIYTVRVPAANFQAFCDGVGGLCQVNSISRNAQDVSEAYYDIESRLATQQTKLERLQTLLAKAENMEDIISLEYAISDTELAIEQLTGSLRKYDSLVGYATVSIYLREVYQLTEQEQPVIGFWAKLAAAFRSGANGFVYGLQDMLLYIARAWVGWLIFLIFVAAAVIIPLRIVRKKKAAKRKDEDE